MRKILISRLKELRHKMRIATDVNEKKVYAEAIVHCVDDIKHMRAKGRRDFIRSIIVGIVFVCLLSVVMFFLISTLSPEEAPDGQIGHAVTDA